MKWDPLLKDCVNFAQRLIQTPSMPHKEAKIAALVAAECRELGFDDVWIDEIGNVNGRIRGKNPKFGAIVLNTHLDHVDPGDPDLWSSPPFAAEIREGRIYGRGACDIKGPLAVQVYSMAALLRHGERPQRDVVFSGVVQEEIGGAGAIHWVKNLDYEVALVVLGEPSDNKIALGHRGIAHFVVTFHGRSVHASVPEKGDNPNYAMAEFLQKLQTAQHNLSTHELLGKTTVSPTIVQVDTKSQNVIPAWTKVCVDFRTASESLNSLQTFIRELAGNPSLDIEPAFENDVTSDWDKPITGFYSPPESDFVIRAKALIEAGMGRQTTLSSYQFATDGRHFVPYGLPMIGFAASEESLAHVANESISIEKMLHSLKGHAALLRDF